MISQMKQDLLDIQAKNPGAIEELEQHFQSLLSQLPAEEQPDTKKVIFMVRCQVNFAREVDKAPLPQNAETSGRQQNSPHLDNPYKLGRSWLGNPSPPEGSAGRERFFGVRNLRNAEKTSRTKKRLVWGGNEPPGNGSRID